MVAQFKNNRYSGIVYNAEGDTHYDLQKDTTPIQQRMQIPELKKR